MSGEIKNNRRRKITKKIIADKEEVLEYLTKILRGEAEEINTRDRMKAAELLGKHCNAFVFEDETEIADDFIESIARQIRE